MARGFAAHLQAIDGRAEVPPSALLPYGCSRAVPYLYAEDDGEVRSETERHLQRCPVCREEVAGLRQVRGRLAEWDVPESTTHGRIVVDLSPGPRVAHHRGHRCYYGHGAWYRAHGPRYVAVHPPVGLTVSFLPAFSATMHVGDARYYRAGPVYYTWSPRVRGYVVTDGPY